MTDNKDKNTESENVRKTLTLKRDTSANGTIKQNFSHGRIKSVVVETKRRKFKRADSGDTTQTTAIPTSTEPLKTRKVISDNLSKKTGNSFDLDSSNSRKELSAIELEARRHALKAATLRSEQEKNKRTPLNEVQDSSTQPKNDLSLSDSYPYPKQNLQTSTSSKSAPLAHPSFEGAEISKEVQVSPSKNGGASRPSPGKEKGGVASFIPDNELGNSRKSNVLKPDLKMPKAVKGDDDRRRRSKLRLSTALDDDDELRGRSIASMRRRQEKYKRALKEEPREKISRDVIIPETITLQELAQRMAERSVDVIKFLMRQGQMVKPGDVLDADMAQLIAEEFGHTVRRVAESDVEDGLFTAEDNVSKMVSRPAVVTIMGHVDHGKTSLLDALRQTNVVSGEAGGITQHIGAYQIEKNGKKITFIDTPGHAAFTAMRARGAKVTDIAILVVAADDSVMPQTVESINHAKAAGVPLIVAINKIDKPSADPQKVRTALLQHNVFVESMGGETLDVEVSAQTGQNLDVLLDSILLQAEMLDLKADSDRVAEGTVIEAKLDKGRGPVSTVLIEKGTIRLGDIIVAGSEWGRVRALTSDQGKALNNASPSTPVEILGMQGVPLAGDRLAVVSNEAKAREISSYRQRLSRDRNVARQTGSRGSLEQMMTQLQTLGTKEFPLIIKGDVQGSLEAITASLEKISTAEVRARIVHLGVGGITESDISLATTSGAIVLGFNVRPTKQARDAANHQQVEIRYYNIIYDLIDDLKAAMSGLLTPERRETFLGNAEVLEVFNISKIGRVAGCRVTEGKIERGSGVRLVRDNVVIYEGKLKTLKRYKDEVAEVSSGQECGMAFESYEDLRPGDVLEAFRVEHITRRL